VLDELSDAGLSIAPAMGGTAFLEQKVIKLESELPADDPKLIATLHRLARAQTADGDRAAAEELYAQIRVVADLNAGASDVYLAYLEMDLSRLDVARGEYDIAEARLLGALRTLESSLGEDHRAVLSPLLGLAALKLMKYETAEAQPLLDRALATARFERPRSLQDEAVVLSLWGSARRQAHDYEGALSALSEAAKIQRDLTRSDSITVAVADGLVASVHLARGDYDKAQALLARATRSARANKTSNPRTIRLYTTTAQLFTARGYPNEALAYQRAALKLAVRYLGKDHPDLMNLNQGIAESYFELGQYAEAAPLCHQALRSFSRLYGDDNLATVGPRNCVARLCTVQGDHERAQQLAGRSEEVLVDAFRSSPPRLWSALLSVQDIFVGLSTPDARVDFHDKLVAATERSFGFIHPILAPRLLRRADALNERGRFMAADIDLARALALALKHLGERSAVTAKIRLRLARSEFRRGELDQSAARISPLLEVLESRLGSIHPEVADALTLRADLATARGDDPGGRADRERSAAIRRAAIPGAAVCSEPVV
jgi:tetratricopeptide (TPR) repeat protein